MRFWPKPSVEDRPLMGCNLEWHGKFCKNSLYYSRVVQKHFCRSNSGQLYSSQSTLVMFSVNSSFASPNSSFTTEMERLSVCATLRLCNRKRDEMEFSFPQGPLRCLRKHDGQFEIVPYTEDQEYVPISYCWSFNDFDSWDSTKEAVDIYEIGQAFSRAISQGS